MVERLTLMSVQKSSLQASIVNSEFWGMTENWVTPSTDLSTAGLRNGPSEYYLNFKFRIIVLPTF